MTNNRPTLEVIAPTVEEAIDKGLEELGLTRADIEVEVLDEGGGGLFGLGSRQARVMLIVQGAAEPEQEPWHDAVTEEATASTETSTEPKVSGEADEDNYLISLARDTVAELLEKMKVDAETQAYLGEPYGPHERIPIHVDIHGDDLSILIGHRGETLDALQYIARLIVGKELERSVPLIIDVEGYRQRREQQVRRLTRRVAEQVAQTNRSQSLEPMPANERRISHIELRDHPHVYTESTGVGRHRKVVIYPKD
jgi:spoIIIJ-associated protein